MAQSVFTPMEQLEIAKNGFDFYGSDVYPGARNISEKIGAENFAKSLGGVNVHGDAGDYIDMGNLSFNGMGHGGDDGKLPWHPTFSDQSWFATNYDTSLDKFKNDENIRPVNFKPLAKGGKWTSGFTQPDTYYPTQEQMMRPGYRDELQRYFNSQQGRGIDKVVMPAPYAQMTADPRFRQ